MRATAFVGGAVLATALAVAHESAAADSYVAPLFGVTGAFGARGGWGGPDAAILGGGLFAGARWGASGGWRAGVLGDASWWRADPGVAVDFGGFISGDVLALWLDPAISVGWFVRGEPTTFRWVSSTARWAYVPGVGTGIRAAGWELGMVGRPEVGFEAVPGGSRVGVDVEWQIGVDLVEFVRLLQHFSAAGQPLAP
jgi:hypothetical protein